MEDKEASELWVAIQQIRNILEYIDKSHVSLTHRDKLTSRIYHESTVRGIGKLDGLIGAAWRDSQREEAQP